MVEQIFIWPIEVICHGDFAPYNVTIVNEKATNIIDFDTIHPGSRMWDIVYAIYRFIPLTMAKDTSCEFSDREVIEKIVLFFDEYGLDNAKRFEFVQVLIERLWMLVGYMSEEAERGNVDFQRNIEEGHMKL